MYKGAWLTEFTTYNTPPKNSLTNKGDGTVFPILVTVATKLNHMVPIMKEIHKKFLIIFGLNLEKIWNYNFKAHFFPNFSPILIKYFCELFS